jgi:DNA-binding transcriptional LysR family regulator
MIPADEMILFVELIRCKSFSNVAKKFSITPAAVSKRISFLEKNLGVKLLLRTTRTLAPTEAGDVLFSKCLPTLSKLQEAYDSILDLNKSPRGILKVSSPTNFSNLVLAPIIAKFSKKYIDIYINVIINDVRKMPPVGDYDIAIRSGTLEDSSAICKLLTTIKFSICATPEYIKKYGLPKKPDDLEKHNCIDYDYRQEGKTWTFFKNKECLEVPVKGNITSNNAFFVKQVALSDAGIVCLPSFMVSDEIKKNRLIPLLVEFTTQQMPVSIIYPNNSGYKPKKLSLFLDFLMTEVEKVCN